MRAIQSEAANSNTNRQSKYGAVKTATRRAFESKSNETSSTIRPAYKRRTFSTTTTTTTSSNLVENSSSRFKITRKPYGENSSTIKPKRQFTPRVASESVLATTTSIPSSTRATFKKPTRGNYRPKAAVVKSTANDDGNLTAAGDEENYPEHFKALLKNREVITQESDKSVLKKPLPLKPLRQQQQQLLEKTTKASVKIKPNAALYKPRPNRLSQQKAEVSTSESPISSTPTIEATTSRRATLRTRPPKAFRPTEKSKVKIGNSIQEPPLAKLPRTQVTRTPLINQIVVEESMNVNTQITDETNKQIDPPQESVFPRTSAVSENFLKILENAQN